MNQGPLRFERSTGTSIRPTQMLNRGFGSILTIRYWIPTLGYESGGVPFGCVGGALALRLNCHRNQGVMRPLAVRIRYTSSIQKSLSSLRDDGFWMRPPSLIQAPIWTFFGSGNHGAGGGGVAI